MMSRSSLDVGSFLRFPGLFENSTSPIIIAPVDDSLLSGPIGGLERFDEKLSDIVASKPDAILTFAGSIRRSTGLFLNQRTIVNLSGSLTRSCYTRKSLIASVEDAVAVNAAAVAVHVNVCSEYAHEMLGHAGLVASAARRFGLPFVGVMYPRGERDGQTYEFDDMRTSEPEAYGALIAHCIRVGVDLGCDLIKTHFTDNRETFARALEASSRVPVVVAGGPLLPFEEAVAKATMAVDAGAAGISFARNLFGRSRPEHFLARIRGLSTRSG